MKSSLVACAAAVILWGVLSAADSPPALDPVARLAGQMEAGEARLEFQKGPLSYLPSLLKNLDIDPDSQVLVFSKTSFQAAKISPDKPRAVFFNDNVSVGSVQDSDVFELLATSPKDGLTYYTVPYKETEKPRFEKRAEACNSCHAPLNGGFPGMMVTSVFPGPDGMPFSTGVFFPAIDHRSAFDERWGGWYVTGTHGNQKHRGNAIVPDPTKPAELETKGTQNLTDLSKKVDLTNYYRKSSDIVALMTLEHQTGMTNYLVRVGLGTRKGLSEGTISGAGGKKLDALADEAAAYMLFAGEMPIKEPIEGNTGFAKSFSARGPWDTKGRSLREFDLKKRMFKYPLSYMIYSEAFDNMPQTARDKLFRRLYDGLTGKVANPKLAHLSAADRQAIYEIVRDTKSNLPEYWK